MCVCSQAEGSWSKERCCAVQGNGCVSDYCRDQTSSSDYLYRLSPGEPERYEPTPGGDGYYQTTDPSYWPWFGYGSGGADLNIGYNNGPPGAGGYCDQGFTYHVENTWDGSTGHTGIVFNMDFAGSTNLELEGGGLTCCTTIANGEKLAVGTIKRIDQKEGYALKLSMGLESTQ